MCTGEPAWSVNDTQLLVAAGDGDPLRLILDHRSRHPGETGQSCDGQCQGVRAVEETAGRPDENGWSRVELPVEPGAAAVGELLRFGGELEVVAPEQLRAQVAAAVRKTSDRYG